MPNLLIRRRVPIADGLWGSPGFAVPASREVPELLKWSKSPRLVRVVLILG